MQKKTHPGPISANRIMSIVLYNAIIKTGYKKVLISSDYQQFILTINIIPKCT
jgi:hypothetical protein